MPITFRGMRFTPTPIINISKSYKRLGDSRKVKPIYNLTLDGDILANKGSPIAEDGDEINIIFQTSGGVNDYPADTTSWTIQEDGQALVILKQSALRAAFSSDGELQVIPWNSSPPIRAYCRVISIEFPEDLWFKRCRYKVVLEADQVFGMSPDETPTEDIYTVDSGNIGANEGFDFISQYYLEDASESHSMSMDPDVFGLFKVTHNISAKGYRNFSSGGLIQQEAWMNARDWVNSRTGFNSNYIQSGTFGSLTGYSAYNQYRTENISVYEGSYSIQEDFILSTGNYYEEYLVETRDSVTDPYRTVNVQGTINGLTTFHVGVDTWTYANSLLKYQAASGAYFGSISGNIYLRAQNQLGFPLNPIPVSQVVSHNFNKGVISYNTELNTRPLTFVSGAISETLSVQSINEYSAVTTIAEHVILNRVSGGILQSINTTPNPIRTVSYEAVFPSLQYGSGTTMAQLMALKPTSQVNQLLSGLAPSNYYSRYVITDDETWSPLTQRYSRQFSWKWMKG